MKHIQYWSAVALVLGATSCIQENSQSLLGSMTPGLSQMASDANTPAPVRSGTPGPVVTPTPTNPPGSAACSRGPTLLSITSVASTTLTANWDGNGVTEILFQIKNSGGTVVASANVRPSSSNTVLSFGALPAANYTLVFSGVNCVGTSQLAFTVSPVVIPSPTPTPTLAACARGPSLATNLSNVTNKSLTGQFDGDGIAELSWQILNSANGKVAGATFVPSSSVFNLSFSELATGTYQLVIAPTKCKAVAGSVLSKSFTIMAVVPSPTPTVTPTPTPTSTPDVTMADALAKIRTVGGTSSCVTCHNGAIAPNYFSANETIMRSLLDTVIQSTAPTATKLYVRSQKGETHASYSNIVVQPAAWQTAIQAYLTAKNSGSVEPPVGTQGGTVQIDCNQAVRRIAFRLTGETITPLDSEWQTQTDLCKAGNLIQVAKNFSSRAGFINNIALQFITPLQHSSGSLRKLPQLSHSGMTMLGIIRDDRPISDFLTGNYFYRAEKSWSPSIESTQTFSGKYFVYRKLGIIVSPDNEKAFSLVEDRSNLADGNVLSFSGNRVTDATFYLYGAAGDRNKGLQASKSNENGPSNASNYGGYNHNLPFNDHDAGVLTTEGFATTNLRAGTNRRAIQSLINQFWCLPLDSIRNPEVTEEWIGKDVTRNPQGPGSRPAFEANCRTCHGVMDGLRGAFYHLNAQGESFRLGAGDTQDKINVHPEFGYRDSDPRKQHDDKYYRNAQVAPEGYQVKDNTWQAKFSPAFMAKVGWPQSRLNGKGLHDLGRAFAESRQFYSCMVKKAADIVCPTARGFGYENDLAIFEGLVGKTEHNALTSELQNNKVIRRIFEKLVVNPNCLGEVKK